MIQIRETVSLRPRGVSLAELATALDAAKSSVQELTNGLLARGYLIECDRRFHLGPGPFILAVRANKLVAVSLDHEFVAELARLLGCTVLVGVRVGDAIVFTDLVGEESPSLTFVARTHARRPLYTSAAGKTLLASVAVAWLTVDDDDNNAVWFLAHLLESIRMIRPALAASLAQVLEEHGDDSARYVLTSLIDEIHHNDDRITLVVDDWHRVSDSQTTAALGFLLEHGCHHLQLIMTSWSHAGRPRLVGRRRCGAGCLNGRVGGRPTARYFVLTRRCRRLKPARSACGANDVIGEFLAESVLDTLEPEIADFMLATSITERTCGGLASALSEQPRGLAMLEEVARRGLFLHRVDDHPGWFRITSCSPNSYAVDLHATLPSGVGDCTARRRHGSPNMATSTRPSTMRSRSTTRNLPLTWSSATRHVCSRSQK